MRLMQLVSLKTELFWRNFKFHVLIPLNLIIPIYILYYTHTFPYQRISEQPGMIALISIASVLNLFICTLLGEEINREGFRALLFSAFFNYLAFTILMIWYFVTINSKQRVAERDSREKMRQMLRIE